MPDSLHKATDLSDQTSIRHGTVESCQFTTSDPRLKRHKLTEVVVQKYSTVRQSGRYRI